MTDAQKIVNRLLENDVDPKDFAMGTPRDDYRDVVFVAKYMSTPIGRRGVEEKPYPYYFVNDDQDCDFFGSYERGWERAAPLRLADYVNNGVLDENDLPFATEAIVLINPDGSPGEEIPVSELPLRFNGIDKVIDTYVSPEENEEDYER